VAITGGAFAIGAQLGYEQWTKSATAAKRHALLATPVPSEASPEKIAADLPQRATDGQSRSYPAVLERSLVAVQSEPEKSIRNEVLGSSDQEAKTAAPEAAKASPPAGDRSAARSVSPEDAAFLFAQGQEWVRVGDLASARALFERAAEGGHGQAAYALAASYDPAVLRRFGIGNASADAALARAWYEKAAKLGVPTMLIPDTAR